MGKEKVLSKIEKLERQILLNFPLNRLPLEKSSVLFQKALRQLKKELTQKGFNFFPHIWIATEWYCPDGVCGIAVPFYLFNKTLIKMEKEIIGRVEGESYEHLIKLLRHETGHAFENLYGTRSHSLRKMVFGSSYSQAYPSSYKPRIFSGKYVNHLGDGYAQSHPDEDFAETFATWLALPKKQWQQKFKNKKYIFQKLKAIDQIALECREKSPLKTCTFKEYDPIWKDKRTLKEYYKQMYRRYKPNISFDTQQILKHGVHSSPALTSNSFLLNDYIKKNKSKMLQELSNHLGIYQYQASQLIKPLEKELQQWRGTNKSLTGFQSEKELYSYLMDAVTLEALESMRLKKDRVYL